MKIVVKKGIIESAAEVLSKVIDPKNVLPIMSNILCEVEGMEMKMRAGNGVFTLSTTIPLEEAEGSGAFCVSGVMLADSLSSLSEQPLTIIADTENGDAARFLLTHSTGETYFALANAEEYPVQEDAMYEETIEVEANIIRDALKRSMWAMAKNDLRQILCGINFSIKDGWLEMVATEGRVMVKTAHSIAAQVEGSKDGFIMPESVAKVLHKLISGGTAHIAWSDRHCRIDAYPYTLRFSPVDGKYPDYNKVIPEESPLVAVVPRSLLVNALKNIMPFGQESSHSTLVKCAIEGSEMLVAAENFDYACGAHDKLAVAYDQEPIKIGLSGELLMNILTKLDGQEVDMCMTDASHGVVFYPEEQPDEADVTMLLMPMMIE